MTAWISVKDKLPEIGQRVLTFGIAGGIAGEELPASWVKGTPIIAITQYLYNDYIKVYFWDLLSSGCGCCDKSFDDVTHWMPLPAPPIEER